MEQFIALVIGGIITAGLYAATRYNGSVRRSEAVEHAVRLITHDKSF